MIRISSATLPEAYHTALTYLSSFGEDKFNVAWNQKRKEVQAWIRVLHPTQEPRISKLGIFGPRVLQSYEMELVDGIKDFESGINWTYTYHQRFATQLDEAIRILINDPGSTRALMAIRNEDDIFMEDAPCMTTIQFQINDGKLDMFVTFRSNDLVKATFMNMWGLIRLQEKVANRLNKPVGSYNHIVTSLHCYEKDFDLLEQFVKALQNDYDQTYSYEDDWKEQMEDEIPEILAELEVLKERVNGRRN